MVIHSGSILTLLAYLVALATAIGLISSVVLLIARKFRGAAKVAAGSVASLAAYIVAAAVISFLTPQTIINAGDSYCWDLLCMGVEKVSAVPRGQEVVYKVDVQMFSDANTVKTSTDGALVFLVDDRGRRFPLMQDSDVIPVNTPLNPGQKIKTTLTFVVAADSRQLFLTGEAPLPDPIPYSWRLLTVFMDLHFGYEKLSRKPTLLRVA